MDIPAIAFFNGKGGVGKTTGIINVAGVLADKGEKVLIIDMDKQHNATDTLLADEQSGYTDKSKTLYDVFTGKVSIKDIVKKSFLVGVGQRKAHYCNIDVLPADRRFENETKISKMNVDIKEKLEEFINLNGYTYVLIDMPPSNKAINTICYTQIANNVIVPFSPDIYSISGYSDTMDIINKAREQNEGLNILGIYLSRLRHCNMEIYEALKSFGSLFIDIVIPMSAQIEKTTLESRPISMSKRTGRALEAYRELTDFIMSRYVV